MVQGVPGSPRLVVKERRQEETIVVADPEQRLAAWLQVDARPDANAKLTVTVEGTEQQRRAFRQQLEAIANGESQ